MFGDDTDFPTSVMIVLGIDPATSTEEDWKRAAEEAKKLQAPAAGVRRQRRHGRRAQLGQRLDLPGLLGRHLPAQHLGGSPDIKFVIPEEGATYWTDNMAIPKTAKHPLDAITYMDYVYRPEVAADAGRVHRLHHPGAGGQGAAPGQRGQGVGRGQGSTWTTWSQPADLPHRGRPGQRQALPRPHRGRGAGVGRHLPADRPVLSRDDERPRRPRPARPLPGRAAGRAVAGHLLRGAAAGDVLAVAAERQRRVGLQFTWEWSNYTRAWELYSTQFIRSVVYALIVTALCLVLAYPMAYWIAFYGGARKSTYLFLILLPFFVSFVIRTVSWKFILNDEGIVLGPLKEAGLLPAGLPHAGHHHRRDRRPHLQLPAVHGPAAVRRPGAGRPQPGRGRPRPVRRPGQRLPQGGVPAVAARGVRRRADHLRAGRLRLRQLRHPRRHPARP